MILLTHDRLTAVIGDGYILWSVPQPSPVTEMFWGCFMFRRLQIWVCEMQPSEAAYTEYTDYDKDQLTYLSIYPII